MVHMPALNLTYSNFIINGNGKPLPKTSKLLFDASEYDTTEAILKFDISDTHLVRIMNMSAINNIM